MVVTDSGHRYDVLSEADVVRTYKRIQRRRLTDRVLVGLVYTVGGLGVALVVIGLLGLLHE